MRGVNQSLGAVHEVTDETFESEVLQSDKPVLVQFWAEWCAPCRRVTPIIHQIAEEFPENLKFTRINIDENVRTVALRKITGIPAMKIFKGSVEAFGQVGAAPKRALESAFADYLRLRDTVDPGPDSPAGRLAIACRPAGDRGPSQLPHPRLAHSADLPIPQGNLQLWPRWQDSGRHDRQHRRPPPCTADRGQAEESACRRRSERLVLSAGGSRELRTNPRKQEARPRQSSAQEDLGAGAERDPLGVSPLRDANEG
ncbi:thioredoxin family protein [Streptomyces tendae]